MKAKELEYAEPAESIEDRAIRIVRKIKLVIVDRENELKEAEDKLAEVLEKNIEDITEKDGQSYEWD